MSGGDWVQYAEARRGGRFFWKETGTDVWRNHEGERVAFEALDDEVKNRFLINVVTRSPSCAKFRRRSAAEADARLAQARNRVAQREASS